jgi:hypothetical protein
MPAPPTPKTPPAKGSFGKWIGGHKWEAGLGAGGIAITLYLAYRSRQNAASGTSASPTATNAPLPGYAYPGGSGSSFDPTQMTDAFAALAAELGQSGQKSSSNPSFIPLSAAQAHGYQLNDPSITSYYQSAPGVFTPVSIDSFNPWSGPTLGTAYIEAPSGYTAPQGTTPATGVIAQ